MTDNGERKRPNANYKLSKEKVNPIEEENLTFYYNRQHRLDKAPKVVRDLYEKPLHKFSLLKPLIAGKGRAAIFFTIVIICIMLLMLSLLGFLDKAHYLDGNKLEIKATVFEDMTIIVLKKTIDSKEPYTGAVDIGVSPVRIVSDIKTSDTNTIDDFKTSSISANNENLQIFTHRVFFTLKEEEETRFVVPFNSPKLGFVLQTDKSELKIAVNTE